MKFLIDMNLSPRWVAALNDVGLEAVHWSEVGPADAPDTRIMTYARDNDYVVLTHDLDFSAILAATAGRKPSVVQIRVVDGADLAAHVIAALRRLTEELSHGAVVTVDAGGARFRLLPLGEGR